jgi:hypothetical protein
VAAEDGEWIVARAGANGGEQVVLSRGDRAAHHDNCTVMQ